jgi:hypothetical protein
MPAGDLVATANPLIEGIMLARQLPVSFATVATQTDVRDFGCLVGNKWLMAVGTWCSRSTSPTPVRCLPASQPGPAPMGDVRESGWGRTGPRALDDFRDRIWVNSQSGQRQGPF